MSLAIKINNQTYNLEGPYSLNTWVPTWSSGVYVICGPPDLASRHAILYVGESENLADRGFPWRHEKSSSWIKHAGGKQYIYIAIMRTPGIPEFQRKNWERFFINSLNPPCNIA